MKLTAPHYAIGTLMKLLHEAEVGAVLMERTGPGWAIEFMTRLDDATMTTIAQLGGVVLDGAGHA